MNERTVIRKSQIMLYRVNLERLREESPDVFIASLTDVVDCIEHLLKRSELHSFLITFLLEAWLFQHICETSISFS